jgi:hypothetical protein
LTEETGSWSELTKAKLRKEMQAVAVEQNIAAAEIRIAQVGSDLHRPHSEQIEALMEICSRDGN